MPRVIVTTANHVARPRVGGPVLLDEEVDLIHLDSPHHASQFLERMAMALEGASRTEAQFARSRRETKSTQSYLKVQAS